VANLQGDRGAGITAQAVLISCLSRRCKDVLCAPKKDLVKMKLPTLVLFKAQAVRIKAATDYTVYDENPENADYPYIVMGEISAKEWSDKLENGAEVFSTLHVWSRYHGRKEADEMADAVTQALTSYTLVPAPIFDVLWTVSTIIICWLT